MTDFMIISSTELLLKGYGVFFRSSTMSGLQCVLESILIKPSFFLFPQPRFSLRLVSESRLVFMITVNQMLDSLCNRFGCLLCAFWCCLSEFDLICPRKLPLSKSNWIEEEILGYEFSWRSQRFFYWPWPLDFFADVAVVYSVFLHILNYKLRANAKLKLSYCRSLAWAWCVARMPSCSCNCML